MEQSAEGADHQARADQENERKVYLNDDENVARAMLFTALAKRASAFAKSGVEARSGIFENRNRGEKQAGEERDSQSKEEHGNIDADFVQAGQPGGRQRHEHVQRAVGE